MFVHAVYFWLRPDLTPADIARFEEQLRLLTQIESVRVGHYGRPAATDRPVIDRSYSYALVVTFDNVAGHDAYQVDPVHDYFRIHFASFWDHIKIYDSISQS